MQTIGLSRTLCRLYRQAQCHQEDLSLPTGLLGLKEWVLQLPAVFSWRSIRAWRMPHVRWLKMESLFSLSFWFYKKQAYPRTRIAVAKLRRIYHIGSICSFSIHVIYCYLVIILKVSMIFIFSYFHSFAIVYLYGKGKIKMGTNSIWFPFCCLLCL